MLVVSQVNTLCHSLLVTGEGGSQEILGVLYRLGQRIPSGCLNGVVHFIGYLLVRDIALPGFIIVGQIPQMDQYRQHIILAVHDTHVILKLGRIHARSLAAILL